jgi:hypothetical protein
MIFNRFKKIISGFLILIILILSSLFIGDRPYVEGNPNSYGLSTNWRWTPLSFIGNSSVSTALSNRVDSATLNIASNQTEEFILSLDQAPNGGIFTYSLGGLDQTAWTIIASQSFDSTNGINGTWDNLPTFLSGDENGPSDRLRHVNIPASSFSRWLKFSITNNYSSTQSIKNIGLRKFGLNNDYWVFVGASLTNMSIDYRNMNDAIKNDYGYDPLIFNTGNSGKNTSWLNDNIDIILSAHPNAKFIAIDMGGNDVSFNRPFTDTTQNMRNSFISDYTSVIQKIHNSGKIAIPGRITFRNYPNEYPGKPGTYVGGMPQNGSLPFNTELLDPIIASLTPDFYDSSAEHGAVDLYTYFLNNQWVLDGTDGIHPNVAGREFFDSIWRDTAFRFVYLGTFPTALTPQTFNTPIQDASSLVGIAELTRETSDINKAQSKLDEINSWPEFSTEQASLQTRLNNVVPTSALFYLIDFGRPESNYLTTPNWNNLSTTTASSSVNLITNAGVSSSIVLTIVNSFAGVSSTGLDFTDLPYNAERDSFNIRSTTNPNARLSLSGLNLAKKYKLTFYSSSAAATPSNVTDFTINGVKKSVTSSGNTSQLVEFDNIIPSNDATIVIDVSTLTNYGFINALSIRETENPPSCTDHLLNQDEILADIGGVCGTPVTLNYSAGAHGSVTGNLSQTINSGSSGTAVTAVPDANYYFVNWSDGSTENPITHSNVTSNINMTANFAIDTYSLSYTAGTNGTISGSSYQIIDYGSNGTEVTAVPNSGYHFVSWSDGVLTASRTDSNITANKSVTANFAVNVATCNDGIQNQNETGIDSGGVCSSRTYLIDFGLSSSQQTTLNWNNITTATASSTIIDIMDDSGLTSSIDLIILNRFTSTGATGVDTVSGVYPRNVVLDYFYVANGSYSTVKFSGLSLDKIYDFKFFASRSGTGTRNSEFIINNNNVVLNAMNNTNNTVSIDDITPDVNGEILITIQPEGSATYAYLNAIELTENVVAPSTYSLSYTAGSNGTLTGSASQSVNHGGNGTEVTAVPNSGYHFVDWSDGVLTASRTDSNITANKSVTANFAVDEIVEEDSLIISSVSSSPSNTNSVITWSTNIDSSSLVEYGLTDDYGYSTNQEDLSPRVLNHSVTISDLLSCTTYYFRVKSTDASNIVSTSDDYNFTTIGCIGSSPINKKISSSINNTSGGRLDLTSSGKGISLNISSNTVGLDAVFQIKDLDKNTVFNVSGKPTGFINAGNYVFDIKALSDKETYIPSFLKPIEVSLSYNDSDIENIDENSLLIYRYDNNTWSPLNNCRVNSDSNIITCDTSNFSIFSLFGKTKVVSSKRIGSFIHYGCKDPKSINYNYFSANDPSLCKYKDNKFIFNRDLKYGSIDNDVKILQQFLNKNGFYVSISGVGAKGKETNIFGVGTKNALIRFQKKNNITPSVGILGPKTRNLINSKL